MASDHNVGVRIPPGAHLMRELITISHIDVGVHLNFSIKDGKNPYSHSIADRYDDRLAEISRNPTAVMLLFSAYLTRNTDGVLARAADAGNETAYQEVFSIWAP